MNPSNQSDTTLDLNCTKYCVLAHGVIATGDWRSLQQRVALPVFQRMLLSGKTRLTDCLDRERVSFSFSASQLRNSHVKKLDNTSHTYEIDFADQNL